MPQFMANQVYYLGSNKGARRARSCRVVRVPFWADQYVLHGIGQLELYNLLFTYSGTGFLISTIISQSVGVDDGDGGGGVCVDDDDDDGGGGVDDGGGGGDLHNGATTCDDSIHDHAC